MRVRPTTLLVSAALALALPTCGGSSDGATTSPAPTSGGGPATEQRYAADVEAACARSVAAFDAVDAASSAMREERSGSTRRRYADSQAAFFAESARTLDVLVHAPAPPAYDAFRTAAGRQAATLVPLFRRAAARARTATGADDIREIQDDIAREQQRLPRVPNPPSAFVKRTPSCTEIIGR